VQAAVESRRKKGEAFMTRVEGVLRDGLKEAGITARVESRIKRCSASTEIAAPAHQC